MIWQSMPTEQVMRLKAAGAHRHFEGIVSGRVAPPFSRKVVMPVARHLWLQICVVMPELRRSVERQPVGLAGALQVTPHVAALGGIEIERRIVPFVSFAGL